MLALLPASTPVALVEEYLCNVLIDMGARHRAALVTKVVSRAHERFNQRLLNEYKNR